MFIWVSDDLLRKYHQRRTLTEAMNANGKYLKPEIKKTIHKLYEQHKAREAKL